VLHDLVDSGPTPLAESTRRLDSLVSPYTGIVRGVEDVLAEPADIRLANVYCETGYVLDLVGHGTKHLGAGSSSSRPAARAAAIAEAVERYSACDSDGAPVVLATAAELGPRAVAPARFALFSEVQHSATGFQFARFDELTPVAWVEGLSLPDGAAAYLPAQLVYLGWSLRPGEQRIARSTSNGLACRASFADAVLTGLLEVLERDAFMITWKARISWPRLRWNPDGALAAFERRYVRPTGLRVAAIDLSAFWNVPCVLGVARATAAGEAPLGVGAGAATEVERAVEKALDEAVRVRSWARAIRTADPHGAHVPQADEVRDFEEHIRYHAYDEHAAAADFLDSCADSRDVCEVPGVEGETARAQIAAVCARLEARGASAYAVDVTSPDVRAAGLRVAKVVAHELCPLDVEHGARHLGGRRLYDEPVRLGRRAGPLRESDLNREPHPFP
jgi:ribosomal protein S12 methylthiotransferase accessory factor